MQNLSVDGLIGFMIIVFVAIIGFFLGAFYKKVDKISEQLNELKTDVKVLQAKGESHK